MILALLFEIPALYKYIFVETEGDRIIEGIRENQIKDNQSIIKGKSPHQPIIIDMRHHNHIHYHEI